MRKRRQRRYSEAWKVRRDRKLLPCGPPRGIKQVVNFLGVQMKMSKRTVATVLETVRSCSFKSYVRALGMTEFTTCSKDTVKKLLEEKKRCRELAANNAIIQGRLAEKLDEIFVLKERLAIALKKKKNAPVYMPPDRIHDDDDASLDPTYLTDLLCGSSDDDLPPDSIYDDMPPLIK